MSPIERTVCRYLWWASSSSLWSSLWLLGGLAALIRVDEASAPPPGSEREAPQNPETEPLSLSVTFRQDRSRSGSVPPRVEQVERQHVKAEKVLTSPVADLHPGAGAPLDLRASLTFRCRASQDGGRPRSGQRGGGDAVMEGSPRRPGVDLQPLVHAGNLAGAQRRARQNQSEPVGTSPAAPAGSSAQT